jgi:hypothetical protein
MRKHAPGRPPVHRHALLLGLVLAAMAAAATLVLSPAPVAAQQAPCVATVNTRDTALYRTYGDAVRLRYTDDVTLNLFSNQPLGAVAVTIKAGPYSNTIHPLREERAANGTAWGGLVSLRDHARYGVGLYQVTMTSDSGCALTLWAEVAGKSAVSTWAGGGAGMVAVLGAVSQIFGLFQALRRSRGRWLAILGGLPLGLGACVLSQQAGLTPITLEWAGIWTAPPMLIGAIIQGGLGLLSGGNREDLDGARFDEAEYPDYDEPTTAPPAAPVPPAPLPPAPTPPARPPSVPAGSTPGGSTGQPSSAQPTQQQQQQQQQEYPAQQQHQSAPPPIPDDYETSAPPPADRPSSGSVTRSARPAADTAADPPRTAYALLDCPGAVVAGEEFELEFGISPVEVAGVAGPALVRPESSVGAYFLTVQIVAEDFDLRPDEHWRHELPVTPRAPYPVMSIHLTPKSQTEPVRSTAIQAIYSVSGQSMGFAVRPVAILANPGVIKPPEDEEKAGATIAIPTDEPAADLTVRIQLGHDEGALLWTFDTPHASIVVPDEPATTRIGNAPKDFARKLVDQMGTREGQPGVYLSLVGIGKTIADQMPPVFWDMLAAAGNVARAESRVPSLFLLSEEPHVPWELALMPTRLDPALPGFLGAQACMGRWALGKQRPKLPPPQHADAASIAVIAGEYNQPGWNRLLDAEQEAVDIAAEYGAVSVNAARLDVLRCLNGAPEAGVLHFAVHGIYDPNSVASGIALVDGHFLDEFEVRGSDLSHGPFVFLNACQVGSGQAILGDYGGMSHAFLYAGAGGVVAPLWSIKDNLARQVALRFYTQAFDGTAPAEVMRRERATFVESLDTEWANSMAYIWYGHPSFTLKRSQGDDV